MNDDNDDLPALPNVPDTGDELAGAASAVAGLDDDAAARKIRTRTSWFGRIVGLTLIVGGAGLGFFGWQRSVAFEHRWDAYTAAQEAPSVDEFLRILREEYPRTTHQDVRLRMLEKFGERRDTQAVPLLVTALGEPGAVRAQAARSLARIGSPGADGAKPDLMRVLPMCDARDRAPVVWALAVLNEAAAADAIVEEFAAGHLQGQSGFDPRIIVTVLGVARLGTTEMTAHANTGVRTLVAQALSEAGTPDVIDPLTRMLRDEDDQVRRQAASGLGRIGDPRAAGPLFAAMQENPTMRVQVLEALRRSVGARGLAVLLASATDDATRRDLAIMIRATHDPAGADALATLLPSTDDIARMEAAAALAEPRPCAPRPRAAAWGFRTCR